MLDVGEQSVTHGFDQCFRCFGVVHPERVLAHNLYDGHGQNGSSHDPQVLSEIGESANGIDGIHDESREVTLLAAQGAVYRGTDDLGLEHICQCRHTGSQNGYEEVPFGTF